MAFRCKFKIGDVVRWNAPALHGEKRRGWIIEKLEVSEGLQPIYKVRNAVTGEVGSAIQWDLEGPIEAGLRLTSKKRVQTRGLCDVFYVNVANLLNPEPWMKDSQDLQPLVCLEDFQEMNEGYSKDAARHLAEIERLSALLKAVQTDAGNWLHSSLQDKIEQAIGHEEPL